MLVSKSNYIDIGDIIEVDLEEEWFDGAYTIFVHQNGIRIKTSIQ